ncbi:Epoxide hydrolase N terminus [Teratosphaeria destructans]|uniref:Epoxide hydrolase N terminus n=1 Tax=Teratosphaeria destructans TaxID=418781 RepID=A0A9W7W6N1_9PEZI|nr:Epoxide hydrolase N terminus [Teratosphaeria destructans]
MAYALEHGSRPATIGLVLATSPLALLAWIGEKFLEWSDEAPALDEILASVSLYWLTETFARCIYPYRGFFKGGERPKVEKPSGYSFFPKELVPTPRSQAAAAMNLVVFKQHTSGGHFAAMEKPVELLEDVEEWVKVVWKGS